MDRPRTDSRTAAPTDSAPNEFFTRARPACGECAARDLLERTFESLNASVIVSEAETGVIVDCNAATARILGYTRDDLAGHSLAFLHAGPEPYEAPVLESAGARELRHLSINWSVRRKDGAVIEADHTVSTFTDETGRRRLVSVLQDITDRVRADETMRRSHGELTRRVEEGGELLDAFFRTTQTCLVLLDREFNFVRVNEAYANACRRGIGEFRGRNHFDLYPSPLIDEFRRVVATNQVWTAQARPFIFPDHPEWGTTFWDLSVVPIRDGRGEVSHLVFSLTDVTPNVRVEEELRQQHEHLEELVAARTAELEAINRELSDFAHAVSHDLKAPLRAVSSLTNWLASDYADRFDDEGRAKLALLTGRVKRMHDLIEGVLRYARVGKTYEDRAAVDCGEAARRALDLVAPPPHVAVTVEGGLPSVIADRTRLTQVFQNLIGNAVKFCDKPSGEVRVACVPVDGFWRFSVTDNGPGIDEKHHERIFKIFQTLHARDDFESTGVGLAIVRRIVEGYGGRAWVESAPGRGSTFYFTLPRGTGAP